MYALPTLADGDSLSPGRAHVGCQGLQSLDGSSQETPTARRADAAWPSAPFAPRAKNDFS